MLTIPGLIGYAAQGPLDKMQVQPGIAYGIARQLSMADREPAILVTRSSDNTTDAFGYKNGLFDSASCLAFCGGSTGTAATVYNKGALGSSGDSIPAASPANQPIICSGGVLQVWSGLPTLLFSGNQYLTTETLQLTGSDGQWSSGVISNSESESGFVLTTGNPDSAGVYALYLVSGLQAISFGPNTYTAGIAISSYPNVITSVQNNVQLAVQGMGATIGTAGAGTPMDTTPAAFIVGTSFYANLVGTFSETVLWQTGENPNDILLWRHDAARAFKIPGVA